MIFIELINSPFESVGLAAGRALTKGIAANLDEIKDELFKYIFDALEYLQIVFPLSSAPAIEEAALVLAGSAVSKKLFND